MKLDIDNAEIELSIINAILDAPDVAELIDELFFEFHFQFDRGTRLSSFWGDSTTTVDEALGTMRRLRDVGIRAHFWI